MVNGRLRKWLENGVAVVVSVQRTDRGGEGRLTSFWSRHAEGVPAWLTWGGGAPGGVAQAVDALPHAVQVVEAVVLLVDHHDVVDPLEAVRAGATGAVGGRPAHRRQDDQRQQRQQGHNP